MTTKKTQNNDGLAAPLDPVVRTTLSSTATMCMYLLECGWSIHMDRDRKIPPRIMKFERCGKRIQCKQTDISHDVVLELQRKGIIKRRSSMTIGLRTVAVFTYFI